MAEESTARPSAPAIGSGTGQEIFLGLLWLGTSMYTAHATITGNAESLTGTLGDAAAALPGVVAATLVTAVTIAHAATGNYRHALRRLLVGLGLGIVFGLVAGAALRFGYGSASSISVLAVTVGVAAVIGGALAILPDVVLEAVLWATTWVFFAGVIFGVLQPNVVTLLGGGTGASTAAQAAANTRFFYGTAILTGVIGGVYAYRTLRNDRPNWLWFLVAGALPGSFLLVAEALTRIGGASVRKLVHGISANQPELQQLSDTGRMRQALIVLAVGAAVGAFGYVRTRPKPEPPSASDDGDDED